MNISKIVYSIVIGWLIITLSACEKKTDTLIKPKGKPDSLISKQQESQQKPIILQDRVKTPPKPEYVPKNLPEYVEGSVAQEEALLDERELVVLDYIPVWPPRQPTFSELLVQAALERTTRNVRYDGSYFKIPYPMGDVPDSIGVCTDVVIRSYRQLGVDLQELLHKDIKRHFSRYPNQSRWGLTRPDSNIDHRRVPNLRVFLERHGETLPVTDDAIDYQPGDLVTWKLNDSMVHIGIVANQYVNDFSERRYIIHNIGNGPELGDILFDYEITGHYRYHPELEKESP
ncbi:MAG TPA: DUF1287 domain-containing protein [Thiotrichaceae bacterium]|nr:DUF1287 domain-containing protein [Thiotrichaceae bacterium]